MKVLLFLVGFIAVLQAQAADTSALTREVEAVERQRIQYQTSNDLDRLGSLLCDTLVYTHSSGHTQTKAEFLGMLRAGEMKYLSISPESMSVHIYGDDTAVLTGTTRLSVVSKAAGPHNVHLRYLLVYVKEAGQWKVAAWESTKLGE